MKIAEPTGAVAKNRGNGSTAANPELHLSQMDRCALQPRRGAWHGAAGGCSSVSEPK